MSRLAAYLDAISSGMDFIAELAGLPSLTAALADAPPATAQRLTQLTETYFGTTRFTKKQARARAAATRKRRSLDDLELIETYVRRVKGDNAAWDLRVELCNATGDIGKLARKRLRARAGEPKPGVKVYRRSSNWTLAITAGSALIADMAAAIKSADADDAVAGAENLFFERGGKAARATLSTNVIITLDDLDAIIGGSGDAGDDVVLRMTNGATITGAELATRMLSERGYVALLSPEHGPVNLYRTERLANAKQRHLAMLEHPTCAWPGCKMGAESCHIHHIQPHKGGGETNQKNLAPLCPFHNGHNDDFGTTGAGRIVRTKQGVRWQPTGPPG